VLDTQGGKGEETAQEEAAGMDEAPILPPTASLPKAAKASLPVWPDAGPDAPFGSLFSPFPHCISNVKVEKSGKVPTLKVCACDAYFPLLVKA
jgi:hypothetical protein